MYALYYLLVHVARWEPYKNNLHGLARVPSTGSVLRIQIMRSTISQPQVNTCGGRIRADGIEAQNHLCDLGPTRTGKNYSCVRQ